MLKIGSHISFKSPNYLLDSVSESVGNNANTMMIYLGPPQSTKRVDPSRFKIDEYQRQYQEIMKPEDIIVHAPYIINLANKNKSTFAKEFLISEIKNMNLIGAKYLVLHPGSKLEQELEWTLDYLANNIKDILNKTTNVSIILETMAGKGTEIGKTLEELKLLIDKIDDDRVGICLDTCHLWDGGYDIKNDFELNEGKKFITELERLNLLKKVKVIHLNDSKNEIGSHKDRHANIGQGFIGWKALKNFANHSKFDNIPIILETPYIDNKSPYKEEIKLIKKGE